MVSRVQPQGSSSLYHLLEDSQAAIFCCCCEAPSPGCARRTSSSDASATPPPLVRSPEGVGGREPGKRLVVMGAAQQQQHEEPTPQQQQQRDTGGSAKAEEDPEGPCLYSPFRRSLFPGVPPTLHFYTEGHQVLPLPACIRRQLRWKVTTITPLLIRQTVVRSGFRLTRDGPYWNGTWGKHIKCFTFAEIKGFQKVNHFPGSFHLGRKDKLWLNVQRQASWACPSTSPLRRPGERACTWSTAGTRSPRSSPWWSRGTCATRT